MNSKFVSGLVILLSSFLAINAQYRRSAQQMYAAADAKCNSSISAGKWLRAQSNCSAAVTASSRLPGTAKMERIKALDNYGFALHNGFKFREALAAWTKAFTIGKSFLAADSFELGHAYYNLGRGNQGVASIDGTYITAAEKNYDLAEATFRAGLKSAATDEMRVKFAEYLRGTLILQKYIAVQRGDSTKASVFTKRLAELDKNE